VRNLARWCFRHRWTVLIAWIVAVIVIGGIGNAIGSKYANNFSFPQTDSGDAVKLLQSAFPSQAGGSDQLVFQARTGKLEDPAIRSSVTGMLAKLDHLPYVANTTSPFGPRGEISKDGTIGLGTVNWTVQDNDVPKAAAQRVIDTAQSINGPDVRVELNGSAIENVVTKDTQSTSDILGIAFALVIMCVAFGSILLPLLPLLSALLAIGVGTSINDALTHVMSIPSFAPIVAVLVGLGVGIDYALFIVTRYRNELKAGRSPEDAVVLALDTAGRAVLFAAITVCIALLGMFALGVSFLYGVAVSAALVVALTMFASITLLPAMLGFIGLKALRRKDRAAVAAHEVVPSPPGFWDRWAKFIEGRSRILAVFALGAIVVIALPFFSLNLGLSDAGNDPANSTTRQAYELLSEGFGPGFNGPLELVGEIHGPTDLAHFSRLVDEVRTQPGVVTASPVIQSPSGQVAIATVYPTTAPEDVATANLLKHLRSSVVPPAVAGSSLVVHIGGATALGVDFAHVISEKLPFFVGIVVVLAFLLLTAVFRSLLIPVTASLMNLLSIGAALGVMTAAFQFGWGKTLLSLSEKGPIDVFIPVLLFAILFGLSMDYEVFLVSRMHEEWTKRHDNRAAITAGQAQTGRVITAAAIIMIFVFASFIFGGSRVVKEVGIGFASAILVDAFLIRTILVPALMHTFGRYNWWLPRWLDRVLPRLNVEGSEQPEPPEPPAREKVGVGPSPD
jgi:putative drug exporter of the RND superfamily